MNQARKLQVKQTRRDENGQIAEALKNSDIQSLESIALLLLREIELLKTKQFALDEDLNNEKIYLHEEVERFEISLIREALVSAKGKQTEAAKLLGIKLNTLNVKIKKFKINIQTLLSETE